MIAQMMSNPILLVGAGLGLLLLVAGFVVSLAGPRSVVEERLGRYAESGAMVSKSAEQVERVRRPGPVSDFLNRLGEGTDLFESISRNLARADIKLRPAEYITLIVGSTVGIGLAGTILGRSVWFGALAAVFGFFLPGMYVGRAKGRRLKLFNNQLGDMLNLMVNGLRAGFSTLQAMEAVSRELPSPICDEFRRVVQEMQLGIPMEDALEHLLRRIMSDDLDLVVTERRRNVEGAFLANHEEVRGKTILVVDDLYTTGATLLSCAKALLNVGAAEVLGLTVGRARGGPVRGA